jgi:putative tryptophan/tyrosine transport system substrate-binding protein
MKRREFITLVGGAAAAWPQAARAQQAALPVVGYLGSESADLSAGRLGAFRQGLTEAGYVEGKNVTLEYRWAEGRNDRLPALAADLVRRQVTVIVTIGSTPAALAAKAASTTIPIVFQVGSDPVEVGLVASLAQPGGNLTGVTNLNIELGPKRLQLLHELMPMATVVGLLINPTSPKLAESSTKDLQAAARTLGLQLHVLQASTERDFDAVFATLRQLQAHALVIGPDAFFIGRSEQLGVLTVRHAVPAITLYREFAAAGGLMSSGGSAKDADRRAGIYAGRVLKGERPGDLPVQQTTKVELVINLNTAKALGLTVPISLLGRADEVIE